MKVALLKIDMYLEAVKFERIQLPECWRCAGERHRVYSHDKHHGKYIPARIKKIGPRENRDRTTLKGRTNNWIY